MTTRDDAFIVSMSVFFYLSHKFVHSPFLEKDVHCMQEMTHIIAPCYIHHIRKQRNAEQNRIGFNVVEVC